MSPKIENRDQKSLFSNQFNSHTGGPDDAGWIATSNKSLYVGVQFGGTEKWTPDIGQRYKRL